MVAALTISEHRHINVSKVFAEGETILIGSSPSCDIQVNHPLIASKHFAISHSGYFCRLTVLDHLIAVLVNGYQATTLRDRDVISIGELEFAITISSEDSTSQEELSQTTAAPREQHTRQVRQIPSEFDPAISLVRMGEELVPRHNAHSVCTDRA